MMIDYFYLITPPIQPFVSDKNCLEYLCRRKEKTVIKLLVDVDTDKVIGACMVGPDAAEIIQVCLHSHVASLMYLKSFSV